MKIDYEKELRGYETVIVDRMGYYRDGYICDECSGACPYVVKDIDGIDACYKDTYRQCPAKFDFEED